jgi:hypothetical protein
MEGFHTSQWRITRMEATRPFQKGETFLSRKEGLRIQLTSGREPKYLSAMIQCQILSSVTALQNEFARRAVLKVDKFMRP